VKEYINSFSPTEKERRHSISSFLDPLHPIGTKSIPSSYLSNELLKKQLISRSHQLGGSHHVHGQCLSDKDDIFDTALCFHSRQWISPAQEEWPICLHHFKVLGWLH
jgi:hypothetical protein